MGYYASAEGYVKPKERKDYEKVAEELRPYYEIYDYDFTNICFDFYSNYHDEEVKAILNDILPYISEGEVEYTGDDNIHWRFILKNGEWVEQNGYIVYDDE